MSGGPTGGERGDAEPWWHQTAREFGLSPAMVKVLLLTDPPLIVLMIVSYVYYQRGMEVVAKVDAIEVEIAAFEAERAELRAQLLDVQAEANRAFVAAERCRAGER